MTEIDVWLGKDAGLLALVMNSEDWVAEVAYMLVELMKAEVGMDKLSTLLEGGRVDEIGWLFAGELKTAGLLK